METKITELLNRLTRSQEELLALLSRKRDYMVTGDHRAIRELGPEEERLAEELKACHDERERLLADAAAQGFPSGDIGALAESLPSEASDRLREPIRTARQRSRLLQHESLASWVAMQRSLLHLSQMLEIIASGGRGRPTYERGRTVEASGALMDRAV